MIVCPQPAAAEEGREVLRRGGNAVDAAVVTALVQGVVDPHMCGIGGSGVMLVYEAREDGVTVVEFHARAGSRVRADQWRHLFVREAADRYGYVLEGWVNDAGYQSVAVPGTVAGLEAALERFGTISWDQAVAPAVRHAREGVQVTGNLRTYWTTDYGPDTVKNWERIRWTPESRRIYTKDGELYGLGEVIRNEDLARTLERLGRVGARDFYEGEIAAAIADDFERNGGFITREDLASYRARWTEPIRGRYRDLDIAAAPAPAGGLTLLQMLNYLEGFDLAAMGWPSAPAAVARVRAMAFAFADRERHLADPEFADVPVARLAGKEYAAARRAHDSPHTTHISVVDSDGNAVSVTHTLGASSGVVTPGLGFTYNNYLNCFDPRPGRPNSLAPGKTRVTMMTPALGFRGGELVVVIGAPGGTKIVTGVLQTILNQVDHRMPPLEAVGAPRVDYQGEGVVQAENRITSDVLAGLRAAGFAAVRRPLSYDTYFAKVQLLSRLEGGEWRGASDPRGDGGIALSV